MSFQKNLKNSTVNPSLPGVVLFFMFLRVDKISFSDTLPSRDSAMCLSNLGMSESFMTSAMLTSISSESLQVYRFSYNIFICCGISD